MMTLVKLIDVLVRMMHRISCRNDAREVALTATTDTRITVERRTARRNVGAVTAADAMDFLAFAGGAANVIMQLSWPAVGYGVAESKVDSGSLMKHPWKRARTTFQYLAVAIIGSDDDRAAYRAAVDGAHRQVRSAPSSAVRYNAFDRNLQMWVAACLFIGLEDTYQLLHGPMTPEQAEGFYRSSFIVGTTLQVTEDQWPATRSEFDAYWNEACTHVAVDDFVRSYLTDLLDLRMVSFILRPMFAPLLHFLTVGFLAPVFRDAMGVQWTPPDQRRFQNLFLFVAFVNQFLPPFVRQGGNVVLVRQMRRRVRRHQPLI